MHVIIVTFNNTDPVAYGPYEDRMDAVAALELVVARTQDDTHVNGVIIVPVGRLP